MTIKTDGVPRTELELQFSNINDSVKDIKKLLEKIDNRQQDHFTNLAKVKTDIGYIKKEIKENKTEHKEEITILWDELRRRDKAQDEKTRQSEIWQRWIIGTIVSLGFLAMAALKYFG